MSAPPKIESADEAARRLLAKCIAEGFTLESLHCYADASGSPLFYRARLRRADGEKIIRPIRLSSARWVLSEPPAPANGKPLYRLPDLSGDDQVIVVEGESCADALAQHSIVATTSGSADSAAGADWTPLRGRHVVVWPDNDGAGIRYAGDVAQRLRAIGCAVEVIDAARLGLPAKGDCVDWLAAHDVAGIAGLPKLAESQDSQGSHVSEPEPLRRPIPKPEPYPLAELGPILAPAAESLRRVIQAPDAICGASLLAAASLATQALADVAMDGREHPLSLWLLSIAESGERKSAVDSEAMRAARDFEKDLAHAHSADCAHHAAEVEEYNARRDAIKLESKRAKGIGLATALRELGPPPTTPLMPKVIVGDFTAEGLAKLLTIARPTVGAFTDEAALVFGGHGMTKETVTRTAGTLCKLWDNGTLDRVRAGDGAVKLYGRRLAMHLMAQPVIAERALSDDVLAGQGFLARTLIAWPESTAGTRTYRAENLRDDPALRHAYGRLMELHRLPLPLSPDDRQELRPRVLTLTPEAGKLWRNLHDAIETGMAPDGAFALCKPWASKTPEQALRIAGVLTLVDQPLEQRIEASTLERAVELALWHLGEAVRLAGMAEVSPEVRDAEALLAWAHATERRVLYSSVALQFGPSRIRERDRFTSAMQVLESAGWAHRMEGGAEVDGKRRKHVWTMVGAR